MWNYHIISQNIYLFIEDVNLIIRSKTMAEIRLGSLYNYHVYESF